MRLCDQEGLNFTQVSKRLGISRTAVTRRYREAKGRTRRVRGNYTVVHSPDNGFVKDGRIIAVPETLKAGYFAPGTILSDSCNVEFRVAGKMYNPQKLTRIK
jgi:hypothetical protein